MVAEHAERTHHRSDGPGIATGSGESLVMTVRFRYASGQCCNGSRRQLPAGRRVRGRGAPRSAPSAPGSTRTGDITFRVAQTRRPCRITQTSTPWWTGQRRRIPGTPPTVLVADPFRISRVACPPQPVTEQRFCKPGVLTARIRRYPAVLDLADNRSTLAHSLSTSSSSHSTRFPRIGRRLGRSACWRPAARSLSAGHQDTSVTVSYGTAPASAHGTNGGVPKAARYEMVTRFPTTTSPRPRCSGCA